MKRAVVALALACACAQTPPAAPGHVVLVVDTDAPLPSSANASFDTSVPAPLFDTLRVELYEPGATTPCDGCAREFDATVERFRAGASIVVTGRTPGTRMRARVIVFRGVDAIASVPDFRLEAWTILPPMPSDGGVERRVVLSVDDFGASRGTASAPIETIDPAPSIVGTWPGAQRRRCARQAPPGAACVPGGAYVMGDRILKGFGDFDADELKVVVVSPFFVDAHEATVAEYRASGPAGPKDVLAWSGSLAGKAFEDWCTFTASPGAHERHPMNCVVQTAARKFCQSRGGDLPTEAQLEYLEGALASRRYAWGSEIPECDAAVWGLGGWQGFTATAQFSNICRASVPKDAPPEKQIGYPAPIDDPDVRVRDFVMLGGVKVQDVSGNLTEWTRDGFAPQTSACWRGGRVLRDPFCPPADDKSELTIRGGSWLQLTAAAGRGALLPNEANLMVGIRCVYPAE